MMKRILAGAAAAGFALTLFAASPASAACPTGSQTAVTPANTIKAGIPPLGSTVYGAQSGTAGGYIGITGDKGYLEVGGSGSTVYARGSATGTPVNGEIIVNGAASKACVANTTVKG